MKQLNKIIISILTILYGLPFLYIFCQWGPHYLLSNLLELSLSMTGLYLIAVFILGVFACTLVPVWIGVAWYFFVKRKNG